MIIFAKRGGVWGVRWFAFCTICQRMAQRAVIIFAVLLPFVSFGDWYDPDFLVSIYCYKYNSSGTLTTPLVAETTASRIPVSAVEDWYFSHSFGVSFNSSNGSILYPTVQQGSGSMTNATKSMYCSLCTTNGVWYSLIRLAPAVSTYASSVVTFMRLGYDGSGINNVFTNANGTVTFNCTPSIVFADVLTSTNTVFRRALLDGLSSLSTSVQNVNVDLGQFQSDYSFVNSSHFDVSNVIDVAESDSIIPSRVATSLKSMARNPSNYEYINSVLDSYRRAQWFPLAFSDSDLASPLHNDPRVKQGLKNLGDSFGSGAAFHYTTPLTNELQKLNTNWVSEAKSALSNNTFQITNQLAHMFDDIPNSLGRAIRDTANNTLSTANAAGSIDQRLANGLTVSVVNSGASSVLVTLDGPINIDQTQFNSLSVPLGSLQSTVSDWYSDWYTFFSVSSPAYKWENFYNMVSLFKDQNHIDLVAVTNSFSSISSLSNLLAQIDSHLTNSLPNLTNFSIASSSFSALLLDHYEDYISNSVYASSISKLQSDYPSVYSNLVHFGLSPSGDGDFWSLFGSSLIQLDLLADNFISDMALVRKFADDNIQGGFSSGISSIVEVMPKKEDIVSSASAASNVVSALDLSSTNLVSAFHSVTSHADSVFSPFRGSFETPPSDLVLFKTGNDKYITIPIHEHPEAFRLMRWGFAFALAAVNFIFFPKFVLMLVMLFSKLSQRFVKFYPSVKDE